MQWPNLTKIVYFSIIIVSPAVQISIIVVGVIITIISYSTKESKIWQTNCNAITEYIVCNNRAIIQRETKRVRKKRAICGSGL